MNKQNNLQDNILNYVKKNNIQVTVYLTNGFQIKGKVVGFDNFTVILDKEDREQLIYKHAISTIKPHKSIKKIVNKTLSN